MLLSFLFMFCTFVIGQQIVVRSSGVKYSDFLKNVRAAFSKKQASASTVRPIAPRPNFRSIRHEASR
jgi:hypothetical protein